MIKHKKIKNSDVIRQTLFSLVCVAGSNSSDIFAWAVIKKLIRELGSSYDFLDYIEISNTENIQNTINDIKISAEMDEIDSFEVGNAIQEIVDIFKDKMGVKAGYTFIKEFKNHLGEEYHTKIKEMGVDLRLIDLQDEISDLNSSSYEIKDEKKSNIAFIQKK